jgi:hypothetical protein
MSNSSSATLNIVGDDCCHLLIAGTPHNVLVQFVDATLQIVTVDLPHTDSGRTLGSDAGTGATAESVALIVRGINYIYRNWSSTDPCRV